MLFKEIIAVTAENNGGNHSAQSEQNRRELWRKGSSSGDGDGVSSCGQSSEDSCHQLIIPKLVIEEPSPVTPQAPIIVLPDSPPLPRIVATNSDDHHLNPHRLMTDKRLLKLLEKQSPASSSSFDDPHHGINRDRKLSAPSDAFHPDGKYIGNNLLMPSTGVGMCYLSPFTICTRTDRTISESNLSSSGYSSMASPCPSRCGSNNPLFPEDTSIVPISNTTLLTTSNNNNCDSSAITTLAGAAVDQQTNNKSNITINSMNSIISSNNKKSLQPLHLSNPLHPLLMDRMDLSQKKSNVGSYRLRSYSDSFPHDRINESTDDGISTEVLNDCHIDAVSQLSDNDINTGNSNSNSDNNSNDCITTVDASGHPDYPSSMACESIDDDVLSSAKTKEANASGFPFPLPAIVIEMGDEKCASPVSSRSESPISEWGCCVSEAKDSLNIASTSSADKGNHLYPASSSALIWERKDLLPFTDSDGLYDFPSSDGRSTLKLAHLQSKRYNVKKRERRSSKQHSPQSGAGKSAGGSLETTPASLKEISTASLQAHTTPPSTTSSGHHQCNKFCHSHQQQCPLQSGSRRSPKRRTHLRMTMPNSSSSSDSINSVIGRKEKKIVINNRM